MGKLKTRSAVKKRFSLTGGNKGKKIKRSRAYRRHLLTRKSSKRKRHLRSTGYVSDADTRRIALMLPYA